MSKINFSSSILFLTTCTCVIVFLQFEVMASNSINEENVFQHVAESHNKFFTEFYSNLAPKIVENIVCSPLSAHMILSLVAYGAKGKNADELRSGLRLDGEDSLLHNGFKSLLDSLNNVTDIELKLANTIYVQENVSLVPHFLTISSNFFYSDTPRVDFKNNAIAAKQINSWVRKQTNNKIKDIISADSLGESTKIVLVNAVYFKGNWATPFNADHTENRPFYITEDTKRHVPMMFKKFKYPHAELEELNAKIIELPYSNKDFSMLVILPSEIRGLQYLEKYFSMRSIENLHWRSNKIELFLPKFKYESTIDLKKILQEMGMPTMFSDLADFSGMSETPLKVDQVIQKAFIEVNEEGTEAAATTVAQMRTRRMADPVETFLVDRPFLFVVQHKPSNIPIFIGSIRDLQVLPKKDEL